MEQLGAPRAKLRWRVFRRRYREELELHAVLVRSYEAAAREHAARQAPAPDAAPPPGEAEAEVTEGQ